MEYLQYLTKLTHKLQRVPTTVCCPFLDRDGAGVGGVMLGPYCRLKTTPAGNCQKLDVKEYTSVIKDGQG